MMLRVYAVLGCFAVMSLLTGCPGSDDAEKEGSIKQATDKVAQQAVDHIKTPIDQAKRAQELSEAHNRAVEEAASRNQ